MLCSKSIKKQGGGARNWGKEGEGSEITSAPVEEGEQAAEEVKEEEPDNSVWAPPAKSVKRIVQRHTYTRPNLIL